MAKNGIYVTGTARRNRIPNCKLMDEHKMKKMPRGTSEEFVACVDGVDISNVGWLDNKVVSFLSTKTGEIPKETVKRYDKKTKENITIVRPNVTKVYNTHMGGVDLLDSHHISLRSKKWYFRIFNHLLDITIVNAWLLYQRASIEKGQQNNISQWEFRAEIAKCLCCMGINKSLKRGRPSNIERELEEKRHKGPTTHVPPSDVRTDQMSHWIQYDPSRQRCKLPNCKGLSHYKCSKCGVHLCFTKNKNCFMVFHQ